MVDICPKCSRFLTERIVGVPKHYSIEKYCKLCGYVKKVLDADDKSINVLVEVFKNGKTASG